MIPLLVPLGPCPGLAPRLSHDEGTQLYKVSQFSGETAKKLQSGRGQHSSPEVGDSWNGLYQLRGTPRVSHCPQVLPQGCTGRDCQEPAEHGNATPLWVPCQPCPVAEMEQLSVGMASVSPKKQLSVLHADIHLRMGLFFSRTWTCLPLSARWQGTSLCSQSHQAFLSRPCWKADPPGTTVNSCPQIHALGWCPGEITSGTPRCSVGCVCFSARKLWFSCNLRKFDLEVIKT